MLQGPGFVPDDHLMARIKRAYRHAIGGEAGSSDMWREIERMRAPVHDALMAEPHDALRNIMRDPGATDLFYGADNLSATADDLHKHTTEEPWALNVTEELGVIGGIIGAGKDVEAALDALDKALKQDVKFPNPFRGERGLETSRGKASYRAVHALYQAWRLIVVTQGMAQPCVLEIGPGLGRTAYYAYRGGISDYTTVDLPLGMVAQACYLSAALGPSAIWLNGDDPASARDRIKLITARDLADQRFDVVLNVDSIPEMPYAVALDYLKWAGRHAGVFLSINHEDRNFTVPQLVKAAFVAGKVTRTLYPIRAGYFEELYPVVRPTSGAEEMLARVSHLPYRAMTLMKRMRARLGV